MAPPFISNVIARSRSQTAYKYSSRPSLSPSFLPDVRKGQAFSGPLLRRTETKNPSFTYSSLKSLQILPIRWLTSCTWGRRGLISLELVGNISIQKGNSVRARAAFRNVEVWRKWAGQKVKEVLQYLLKPQRESNLAAFISLLPEVSLQTTHFPKLQDF